MNSKEQKIIESLTKGDKKQHVRLLYDMYFPKIRRYILKNKGSVDDALDVFHDTILVFHRWVREGKMEKYDKLEGFLYVTAKNLWITNRKQKNARERREGVFAAELEDSYFLEKVGESEMIDRIKETFQKIGENCKEILSLSILTDLPMDEISERLGYSNANVAKALNYRCKKKLKELIKSNSELVRFLSK